MEDMIIESEPEDEDGLPGKQRRPDAIAATTAAVAGLPGSQQGGGGGGCVGAAAMGREDISDYNEPSTFESHAAAAAAAAAAAEGARAGVVRVKDSAE